MSQARELVVLLDDDGRPIGEADKATVHGPETPLHLAFSCHVTNGHGELLVTRRALGKRTWPGVWTNSFCGHPAPGEVVEEAVARRALEELGVTLLDLALVVPDFRYVATDAAGVVENEICPVLFVLLDGEPAPRADEVAETQWVGLDRLVSVATDLPFLLSPWCVLQVAELISTGQLAGPPVWPS